MIAVRTVGWLTREGNDFVFMQAGVFSAGALRPRCPATPSSSDYAPPTKRIDPKQLITLHRGRLIGVAACIFALSLAACGGSSSKSSPSTATTGVGASTAPVSPPTTPTRSGSSGDSSKSGGSNFDACTLLSPAEVSSLEGHPYGAPTPQTIASGQDQCTYKNAAAPVDLVVIVYQANSGVTFDMLKSVQSGVGAVTNISGVGDKAIAGSIELDVQVGDRLIAVEGAGGGGSSSVSIALGKAAVAALG